MEDTLCLSQAKADAYEFQKPNPQQERLWARVNICRGHLWCLFIQNTISFDLHKSMWRVLLRPLAFFRKLRPKKLLNVGIAQKLEQVVNPDLCLQNWLPPLILLSIRNWQSMAWSNTTPGQFSEDSYKYSQLKRKEWSFMCLVPNTCTIIRYNEWRCTLC